MRRMDERVEDILGRMRDEDGYDYRYDHFKQSDAIPPPFIVYRRVAKSNFSADGVVYTHESGVDIEIYASTPDEMMDMMLKLEALLDADGLYYRRTADTVYLDSEDFYESLYEL